MNEDKIIAEAEALALAELPMNQDPNKYAIQYRRSAICHALRLANQSEPDPDPLFFKALRVWDEAYEALGSDRTVSDETPAARKIMDAYPGPDAEALQWARESWAIDNPQTVAVKAYILKMAGETA